MSSTLKKPGNPLGLPGFFMPWPAPNCRAGLWRQKHCRHRFVNGQVAQKTSAGIFAAMGSRKRFCTWLAHKAWKAPMAAIGLPWELMVPFVCNAMCTWPVKTGAPPARTTDEKKPPAKRRLAWLQLVMQVIAHSREHSAFIDAFEGDQRIVPHHLVAVIQ